MNSPHHHKRIALPSDHPSFTLWTKLKRFDFLLLTRREVHQGATALGNAGDFPATRHLEMEHELPALGMTAHYFKEILAVKDLIASARARLKAATTRRR
jgi:hypothetical protein